MRKWIQAAGALIVATLVTTARAEDKALPAGASARLGGGGGHLGHVFDVALSPDGTLLATQGKDNFLIVWDTATGKELARIAGPFVEHTRTLAFSPHGKHVAVASAGSLRVWEASTGKLEKDLKTEKLPHGPSAFAFSPDGAHIFAADGEHLVELDLATGAPGKIVALKLKSLNAIAVSHDGAAVALVDGSGNVVVVDRASGKVTPVVEAKEHDVPGALAFSPDAKLLAVTSQHGLSVHELGAAPKESFSIHVATGIGPPVWVEDGKTIVTVDTSARTFRFDVLKKAQEGATAKNQPLQDLIHEVGTATALTRDGKTFAVACSGAAVLSFDGPKLLHHIESVQPVSQLAFSPDGKTLAELRGDRVGLWSLEKGTPLWPAAHEKSSSFLVRIGFSGDGSVLALNSDGGVSIFDAATGKFVKHDAQVVAGISRGEFSADGTEFLTATLSQVGVVDGPGDFHLLPLDPKRGSAAKVFKTKVGAEAVAISHDGTVVVSGHYDGEVKVWDVAHPGKPAHAMKTGQGSIAAIALSPDAKHVATVAGTERTVHVHDVAGEKTLAALEGHTGDVTKIVFSRDGKRVVTACKDGSVRVFEASSGKLDRTLSGHAGPVNDLVLSPDGKVLASGGADGTIVLWTFN